MFSGNPTIWDQRKTSKTETSSQQNKIQCVDHELNVLFNIHMIREAAKKFFFVSGPETMTLPLPPPLKLSGHIFLENYLEL